MKLKKATCPAVLVSGYDSREVWHLQKEKTILQTARNAW